MRDVASWCINLGRCRGVTIRLHVFFLLFSVFTLYFCTRQGDPALVWYGAGALGVLLVSVAIHEFGHALAAFRIGGSVEEIVLGPLGGLVPPRLPRDPRHELVVSVAGPLMNLVVVLATAPLVVLGGGNITGLLHPLAPADLLTGTPWLVGWKMAFWINWVLLLVNVTLPAFPLDGGRILRALLWRRFDQRTAAARVALVANIVAILLCVAAWTMSTGAPQSAIPAWLPLVLLAIFVFFSAKQETARLEEQDLEDELFSYDFSQGYTSLERHLDAMQRGSASPLRRWVESRREARQQRRRMLEQDEERRVDEILARLHQYGIEQLTPKERALLHRVSARYRNRQRS